MQKSATRPFNDVNTTPNDVREPLNFVNTAPYDVEPNLRCYQYQPTRVNTTYYDVKTNVIRVMANYVSLRGYKKIYHSSDQYPENGVDVQSVPRAVPVK